MSRNGLVNYGNSCYMNSVLQCLLSIPCFYKFLKNLTMNDFNDDVNNKVNRNLCILLKNICDLLYADDKSLLEKNVKTLYFYMVKHSNGIFEKYQQTDCGEFLTFFIDRIHEACCKPYGAYISNENISKNSLYYSILKNHIDYVERHKCSVIMENLYGQLTSVIYCTDCKHKTYKHDPFCTLEIPVDDENDSIDLNQCLNNYSSVEMMPDFKCDNCEKKGNILKQIHISYSPNILMFHLKRFKYNMTTNTMDKITTTFQYPHQFDLNEENLNILIHNRVREKTIMNYDYRLISVINHFGSLEGGHYTSDVYDSCLKKWMNTNDSHVREIEMDNSVHSSSNAYFLIYEKIR